MKSREEKAESKAEFTERARAWSDSKSKEKAEISRLAY